MVYGFLPPACSRPPATIKLNIAIGRAAYAEFPCDEPSIHVMSLYLLVTPGK
jgi:hypothetical protein